MVKFIFMNKYIFKLLVILALFYKNIFFYNSLCCNSCKGNILEKKMKKEKKKIKEKMKTEKEKMKEEIKKPKEETKTENEKTKVEGEELEEINIFIRDGVTNARRIYQFPQHIKGSDLKKQVAKNYEGKNIEIRFCNGTVCEGDTLFELGEGETLRVYIVNEKK